MIAFSSETDRIYTDVKPELVIEDSALGRRVRISATGSKTTIVWNPWKEISIKMADSKEGADLQFVCVETANGLMMWSRSYQIAPTNYRRFMQLSLWLADLITRLVFSSV
ncbi:hypothetical protein [cf. Phormidesmis sp. LEGE 11477]|uniref:hypothetical protein n=1 Tax=cf. Phormidesmis sp. LEGE 11477 TaxID=1828680 RepID=UPI00187E58D3|nr:hypothetical protein [cf. Phormidesmis sp. LEGE 11477]MBE9061095.1 hypothetical protein [cf. Phormidesmis sp. LEGE 11477]